MTIQDKYKLTNLINARGTFTPLGVSRSTSTICDAVVEALSGYFIIDELQDLANKSISGFAAAEAATVTHCTASAITVSIAATMTGTSQARIAALPDTTGMANCVVIPAGHCVDYGHSILQAIRISGAKPVIAGSAENCTLDEIEQQITENPACCLLLVSSKLVECEAIDFAGAINIAHKHGIPAIIDGAAQDFRISELMLTRADLVLLSAQKYLASPTAGLVIGQKNLVAAVRAQEKGIGRAMKATKEAIIGAVVAIEEREKLNLDVWKSAQQEKVNNFVTRVNNIEGLSARSEPDPTGLPFSRALIQGDNSQSAIDAEILANHLKSGKPSIWVIDQNMAKRELGFELVQVNDDEIVTIINRLGEIVSDNSE